MNLAGCDQPADNFADLAASRQSGEEELDIFHGCGNYGLQVNGSKY